MEVEISKVSKSINLVLLLKRKENDKTALSFWDRMINSLGFQSFFFSKWKTRWSPHSTEPAFDYFKWTPLSLLCFYFAIFPLTLFGISLEILVYTWYDDISLFRVSNFNHIPIFFRHQTLMFYIVPLEFSWWPSSSCWNVHKWWITTPVHEMIDAMSIAVSLNTENCSAPSSNIEFKPLVYVCVEWVVCCST